jgi:ketosteroid isomerase-like protein
VRRGYDAFNRRDLETLFEVFHPEAEWHPFLAELGGQAYYGHEGIRTLLEEIEESWEDFRSEAERIVDVGDHIIVFVHGTGRGRASGVEADLRVVTVVEMRDGRALRVWSYATLEEALAAAGLERLPAR